MAQVCWSGGHTVCLSQSVLLSGLLLLYLFVCFFKFCFNSTFAFPCQSPANILSFFFLNYGTYSLICTSLPLLLVPLTVISVVYPSLVFSYFQCLFESLLLIFLFPFLSPSLHLPLFFLSSLGSLLTLLNVRAQTSPCRAAPSHRGQKQLVSLPLPCFLAASVCLTVCLPACQCPVIPSTPHSLSVAGWSLVTQTSI